MPAGFVLWLPASCCVADLFEILVSDFQFSRSLSEQNANQIKQQHENGLFRLTEDRAPKDYIDEILQHWTIANEQVLSALMTSSIVDGEMYGQIDAPHLLRAVGEALGPDLKLTLIDNEWGVLLRFEELIQKWRRDPDFDWRDSQVADVSIVAFLDDIE